MTILVEATPAIIKAFVWSARQVEVGVGVAPNNLTGDNTAGRGTKPSSFGFVQGAGAGAGAGAGVGLLVLMLETPGSLSRLADAASFIIFG